MSGELILVLDEGTTSTRAMLFTPAGEARGAAQRELTQYYPRPGWVEHDAAEIWERTLACAHEMVEQAGGPARIAAIGICNQRETVVAWDKLSGEPLARAIVWQDRRTAPLCAELKAAGHEAWVREKTGLLLDPYFSATKMRWLLDNEPRAAEAASAGRLAFGTIESWLVYKLTGAHLTEAGNASRTLLLPLVDPGSGVGWDHDLCDLFGIPRAALGEVVDSLLDADCAPRTSPGLLGAAIPICGLAGDQQAATIGQGCLAPGGAKATYGTGAFILAHAGRQPPRSEHHLLTTILMQLDGERHYALEGSVFVAGSLMQWLRDALGLIGTAAESEALAREVPDSGGVVLVPALAGLGAPHWQPQARAAISGLSLSTGRAHIVRAGLEAMAHQTQDLARAFADDGAGWTHLKVDGGMVANDWMVQDIADITGLTVTRPDFVETTAAGAAMLAATGAGLHALLADAARAMIGPTRDFEPAMAEDIRRARLGAWNAALGALVGQAGVLPASD